MDVGQLIFNTIRNPDVAYMLLILGLFSAILVFAVPGTGLAEVAAGVCLILAVIGLSQLAIDLAGLVLIMVGVGLFIVDLKLQSGAIAVGGAVALGIGSVFLVKTTQSQTSVSVWLIALVTLGSLAFFGFGVNRAIRAMRIRPKMDVGIVVGAHGVLKAGLSPANQYTGTALMGSELWTVKSDAAMPAGSEVVVDRVDGLILWVKSE